MLLPACTRRRLQRPQWQTAVQPCASGRHGHLGGDLQPGRNAACHRRLRPPRPHPRRLDRKILQTFWGPTENDVVTFSPDGKWIATTEDGNTARIWSVATGRLLHTFTADPDDGFASITFSPDGTLFAGGMAHGAEIWDARNGRFITSLPVESRFSRANFSRDGKLLAVTGTHGVRIYSARTWRLIHAFRVNAYLGVNARFSPDSQLLATGSTDGYARIWDITTGRLLLEMQAGTIGANSTSWVYSVDFSPDGKRLVTSSAKTMIWSLATGRRLRTLHT